MSEIIYYGKPKDRMEKWRLLCDCDCYFSAYQKDIVAREKCSNGRVAVVCPKCRRFVLFYSNDNKVEYTLNKIELGKNESVTWEDKRMIFVIQKMINNKKIPLGYTDSWQKAEEMLKKLEQCKHDPKYGSIGYSIYSLDELPDEIPKEWK